MASDEACAADLPGLGALEAVFEALGRVLLVLDAQGRVIRASRSLDGFSGPGAADRAVGEPVTHVLGGGLFGPDEPVGAALAAGQRVEDLRAILAGPAPRLVTLTAAPLPENVREHCDPRARALLVLHPAAESEAEGGATEGPRLVARSPAMMRVVALLDALRHSDAPVLVTGESGTGKEAVARALHARSRRARGPFVVAGCAALQADRLEADLFGHSRGAFPGADHHRVGRFELARDGTLVLDEVGELPPALQLELARVLDDGRYQRLGDGEPRRLQARIVATTTSDLAAAVAAGRFREDLYYRLRVVPVVLPPLRDRVEDIVPLAHQLLARIGRETGRSFQLAPATVRELEARTWPGNVRELENALRFGCVVAGGALVEPEHLPAGGPRRGAPDGEATEAERLRAALEGARWNREVAAERLGISRTTLWRRMRQLGLDG